MLDRRDRRDSNARRALAATELAMFAPVLIFLLLVSVDFGRLFYSYVTLTACARNGAIYASSNSTAQQQSPYYNADIPTATTSAAQADASNLSPLPTVDAPTYCSTYNGTYTTTETTKNYVAVKVNWTF